MVDVTGLKSPFTRKFNGKTYQVNSRSATKKIANKIATSLRKSGKKVRVVKVKTGRKYVIYTRG